MEIKIIESVEIEPEYKIGDIFLVNGSVYTLTQEYDMEDGELRFILRQFKNGITLGCNGFHDTIDELISELNHYAFDWCHYSQDDYILTLTKK